MLLISRSRGCRERERESEREREDAAADVSKALFEHITCYGTE